MPPTSGSCFLPTALLALKTGIRPVSESRDPLGVPLSLMILSVTANWLFEGARLPPETLSCKIDLIIGQVLGHYRIMSKLGEGGMGTVYRARDERLERDVALKLLTPGTMSDEKARRRFRKEATLLSQLNHPNIATVHDFDMQDGLDFLVLELIPGETLADVLADGPLSPGQFAALAQQLTQGLEAAHERGIVHRDLKPGNLQLTPRRPIKDS